MKSVYYVTLLFILILIVYMKNWYMHMCSEKTENVERFFIYLKNYLSANLLFQIIRYDHSFDMTPNLTWIAQVKLANEVEM